MILNYPVERALLGWVSWIPHRFKKCFCPTMQLDRTAVAKLKAVPTDSPRDQIVTSAFAYLSSVFFVFFLLSFCPSILSKSIKTRLCMSLKANYGRASY